MPIALSGRDILGAQNEASSAHRQLIARSSARGGPCLRLELAAAARLGAMRPAMPSAAPIPRSAVSKEEMRARLHRARRVCAEERHLLCLWLCFAAGCAETGSGKTASFAIPMIQYCLRQPQVRRGDGPLALVRIYLFSFFVDAFAMRDPSRAHISRRWRFCDF